MESPTLRASLTGLLMDSLVGKSAAVETYPGKNRRKGNPSRVLSQVVIGIMIRSINRRVSRLINSRSESMRRVAISIELTYSNVARIISDAGREIKFMIEVNIC